MFGFVPQTQIFFDLLDKLAGSVDRGAQILLEAAGGDADFDELHKRIKVVEHEGDLITHETIQQLHRSFITPLDREDIHELACRLDDVLDLIDTTASRIYLYRVTALTEDAKSMVRNLAKATSLLVAAVRKLRQPRDRKDILPHCIEVHTCENEGDRLEQHALAALFDNDQDPRDIIKWKDIYDDLEGAIDKCEDVCNVLEGITLKTS